MKKRERRYKEAKKFFDTILTFSVSKKRIENFKKILNEKQEIRILGVDGGKHTGILLTSFSLSPVIEKEQKDFKIEKKSIKSLTLDRINEEGKNLFFFLEDLFTSCDIDFISLEYNGLGYSSNSIATKIVSVLAFKYHIPLFLISPLEVRVLLFSKFLSKKEAHKRISNLKLKIESKHLIDAFLTSLSLLFILKKLKVINPQFNFNSNSNIDLINKVLLKNIERLSRVCSIKPSLNEILKLKQKEKRRGKKRNEKRRKS